MQLDFLTTVFLTAMSLLGGGALVLSYLHWKEWKTQRSGRWNRGKPLDVMDHLPVKPVPRAIPTPSGRATDATVRDGPPVPTDEQFSRLCEIEWK